MKTLCIMSAILLLTITNIALNVKRSIRRITSMSVDSSSPKKRNYRFETEVVHAGCEPDINNWAVVPPISLATTFAQVIFYFGKLALLRNRCGIGLSWS